MANTYVSRTPASTTNTKTWTWSGWVKLNKIGQAWFFGAYSSGALNTKIYLDGSNNLNVHLENGTAYRAQTDTVLRDFSAWYHIVVAVDTTQATASNRIKVYINGTQQSLTAEGGGYPPQNYNGIVNNSSYEHNMGYEPEGGDYFQGLMSHVHFTDGTAYDASAFGEYDANGVWKIKTSPSVTYGTNGFFILKDGNSVTDQSGNSNNWTVAGGNLTQTEDSPSNVFATLNALIPSSVTYSGGNLTAVIASSNSTASTLGAGTGKFYFETKINDAQNTYIGICSERNTGANFSSYRPLGESVLVNTVGTIYTPSGSTGLKGLPNIVTNDIIGCAFDVDNGKLWWSQNGQWYTANSNPATTITIADVEAGNNGYNFSSWTGQFVLGAQGTSTVANNVSINFGNGYFGTTAVASAGTNASGIGIFEYDVPTGYTALSTKGLNL